MTSQQYEGNVTNLPCSTFVFYATSAMALSSSTAAPPAAPQWRPAARAPARERTRTLLVLSSPMYGLYWVPRVLLLILSERERTVAFALYVVRSALRASLNRAHSLSQKRVCTKE